MKINRKKRVKRALVKNSFLRKILSVYYKILLSCRRREKVSIFQYYGMSMFNYAVENGCKLKLIQDRRSRKVVVKEKIIPENSQKTEFGFIPLFPVYITELTDIVITGESESIIKDEYYLNDRIDTNPEISIDIVCAPTYFLASDKMQAHILTEKIVVDKKIEKGINLVGRWPSHIWHLSFEILPRLYLADQYGEYEDYPLIMDEKVFSDSRNIELVNMMNKNGREIIKIPEGKSFLVNRLVCPSQVTPEGFGYYNNENLQGKLQNPNAIYLFPDYESIDYMRKRVLIADNYDKRKLFVVRKDDRLANEKEIADYFVSLGFEIYDPENLTFAEEVECFSNAEFIICQLPEKVDLNKKRVL